MPTYTNDESRQVAPVTGVLGTVLGGAALALGAGVLGTGSGILGGRQAVNMENSPMYRLSQKDAEIARLESEKYTDNAASELRTTLLTNWLKPISDEAAANKVEIANLKASIAKETEVAQLREQLLEQKVATAQATTNGVIGGLSAQVAALQNCCASITKTVVPNTSVCPGWGNVTVSPSTATATA